MAQKDIVLILEFDDKGTPKVRASVSATKKELAGLDQSARKMGKGMNSMQKQVTNATKGQSRFKKALKSTWAQMAMGMGVMTGVSGAIRMVSRTVGDMVKTGREFERAWVNVTTMMGDEAYAAADDYRDQLLHLSPVLGDTIDLAKGMYQVLSASIPATKAIKFLGAAAKSAQAGVTDTTTAVDALTTVLNAYTMDAERVTEVSDMMFATVKRGKLTYEGLSGALGTVVPIAAQVGVRFEEVAAAMATLTRQGIDVNTTTVQLRQVMVSVLKPTSEAETAARKLGIRFDAVTLKSMGLAKFIKYVTEAVGDDTEALTSLFGNVRALTGIMGLGGKAAAGYARDLKGLETAAGSTEEAFKRQMKSADFWSRAFKNAMGKAKIAMWQGLVSPVKQAIKDSKDFEEKFEKFAHSLIDWAFKVGQSIANAIQWLFSMRKTIINVIKVLALLWATKKILTWITAIKAASVALGTLKLSMGGLALAAGAAYGAWKGLIFIRDKWIRGEGSVHKELKGTAAMLRDLSKGLHYWGGILSKSADEMAAQGIKFKERQVLMKELKDVWDEYGQSTVKALEMIIKGKHGEKLKKVIMAIAGSQGKMIESALGASESAGDLKDMINDLTKSLVDNINTGLDPFAAGLGMSTEAADELKKSLDALTQQAEGLLDVYKVQLGITEEQLTSWMKTISATNYVSKATDFWIGTNKKLTKSMWSVLTLNEKLLLSQNELVAEAQAAGESVHWLPTPQQVWDRMQEIIKKQKAGTDDIENNFVNAFRTISSAFTVLSDSMSGNMQNLVSVAAAVADQIAQAFEENASAKLKDIFKEIGPALAGQLGSALGGAIGGKGAGAYGGIGSAIGGALGSIIPGVGTVIGSLVGGLFGGLFKKKEKKSPEELERERLLKQVKQIQGEYRKYGKISEHLAERIKDLRKEHGKYLGDLMALSDVMAETGIDMKNIGAYSDTMIQNLKMISSGTIDATKGTQALGEAFSTFIQGVKDLGQEGSKYVVEFLQQVRELGQEIEEVNEYVFGWLEKGASGLQAMTEAAGDSEEALQRVANLSLATFNALIEQGMSWTEALALMSESLETLAMKFEELGISGGAAYDQLMKIVNVRKENESLFNAIDANNQALQALGNTGFLTADVLKDVADNAAGYYEDLIAAGLSAEEALAIMAPSLEKLAYYAEQYGFELGQATQELVDQAKEAGLISEAAESELHNEVNRIVDGLVNIEDAIRSHGAPVMAQRGFHGMVTGPQDFRIEPGVTERVDITPAREYEAGEGRDVTVYIDPVVVPLGDMMEGFMIKFIPRATKDEIITVHPNAVRGD